MNVLAWIDAFTGFTAVKVTYVAVLALLITVLWLTLVYWNVTIWTCKFKVAIVCLYLLTSHTYVAIALIYRIFLLRRLHSCCNERPCMDRHIHRFHSHKDHVRSRIGTSCRNISPGIGVLYKPIGIQYMYIYTLNTLKIKTGKLNRLLSRMINTHTFFR